MSNLSKIVTLSFTGAYPETAEALHKQIQEEIEPNATLETVQAQLTELVNDNFIHSAEKPDGTTLYWRG